MIFRSGNNPFLLQNIKFQYFLVKHNENNFQLLSRVNEKIFVFRKLNRKICAVWKITLYMSRFLCALLFFNLQQLIFSESLLILYCVNILKVSFLLENAYVRLHCINDLISSEEHWKSNMKFPRFYEHKSQILHFRLFLTTFRLIFQRSELVSS